MPGEEEKSIKNERKSVDETFKSQINKYPIIVYPDTSIKTYGSITPFSICSQNLYERRQFKLSEHSPINLGKYKKHKENKQHHHHHAKKEHMHSVHFKHTKPQNMMEVIKMKKIQ